MNHNEFREKIRRTVELAIREKKDLDGLIYLLMKVLHYEIIAFSDRIRAHEPLDMALIAYKGRHYFKKGYEKRDAEINNVIINDIAVTEVKLIRLEPKETPNTVVKPLEPPTPPPSTITADTVGDTTKEPPQPIQTISNDTIL